MALKNPVTSGAVNVSDSDYAVVLDVLDSLAPIEYTNMFFYNGGAYPVLVALDGDEDHAIILPAYFARSFAASDNVTVTRSVSAKGVGGTANGCYFEMWQGE